ncbi:MAG: SDR family oxidoreductase, partial [Sneathiella sp.]|nr:SDR family oxidoreductase [Sneathiella sp.]
MDNKNRLILVTGATSGIGLATAKTLKENGYNVILTGRNPDKVSACANEIGVPGYALDVASEEDCASVVNQIEAENGPLWGLVNNAGIWLEGEYETHTSSQIRSVIETNTLGTMFMTHAALPGMLDRKDGAIINVISMGALYCRKLISVYAGSKWAIRGFTGCMEVECAPKGVRVMGFYPGKVETNMYE